MVGLVTQYVPAEDPCTESPYGTHIRIDRTNGPSYCLHCKKNLILLHLKPAISKEMLESLVLDITIDIERTIKQRDEFMKTGISTASHGGSHDTYTGTILRKYFHVEEGS